MLAHVYTRNWWFVSVEISLTLCFLSFFRIPCTAASFKSVSYPKFKSSIFVLTAQGWSHPVMGKSHPVSDAQLSDSFMSKASLPKTLSNALS